MNKHPAIGPELEPGLGPELEPGLGPELGPRLDIALPSFIVSSLPSMLALVINSGTRDTADGGWTSVDDDIEGNGNGTRYTRYSHTFMVGTNDDNDDKAKNSTVKVVLVMCRVVIR